jgi:transcriptional regulator GlxA family with amidase domain
MPVDDLLRVSAIEAERQVLSQGSDVAMVAAAESLLGAIVPVVDPRALLAERAVAIAAALQGPTSVAALSRQVDMEERSLQRLFSNYVGVSPKWVIQRFRLQEANWHLSQQGRVDLAALSLQLGFSDQAHFTRNFTALVGKSPLEYWRSQQGGEAAGSMT